MPNRQAPFEPDVWQRALDWTLALHENPHDEGVSAELARWLAADQSHELAFNEACVLWKLTGQLVQGSPVPAVQILSPSRKYAFRPRVIGMAAVASLVAIGVLLHTLLAADFSTAIGEFKKVTLSDGSQVYLSANSSLNVTFTASERNVRLLSGEAFFVVKKQKSRPFIVRAGDVDVRVLGTRFNVRRREEALQVAVERGQVSVTRPVHGDSVALDAGEMTNVRSGREALIATSISRSVVGVWRSRQLIVDNWSVSRLIAEIKQYRRGFVILTEQELGDEKISGVFDLNQPVGALQAAMQPFGATVQEYGPFMLVISPQTSGNKL